MKFELLKLDIPTIIDTGLKHGHPRIHVWDTRKFHMRKII